MLRRVGGQPDQGYGWRARPQCSHGTAHRDPEPAAGSGAAWAGGVTVSDLVLERRMRVDFEGVDYEEERKYFLVKTSPVRHYERGWTEVERRVMAEH
jgi:hypothetical protein